MQEKFLTLRRYLSGVRSLGEDASEELVEFLKTRFEELQIPFELLVRSAGTRYSFIHYNFLFRRLFDLYGCSHFGVDFPPLKSKRKREGKRPFFAICCTKTLCRHHHFIP